MKNTIVSATGVSRRYGNVCAVAGADLQISAGSVLALMLTGCSSEWPLMPTPNVYTDPDRQVFSDLDESLQSNAVELLYATDRVPETGEDGAFGYGYDRSGSMAFGTTVVELGDDVGWEQLLDASRTGQRPADPELKMGNVTELARAPATPTPFTVRDGEIIDDPEMLAERAEAVSLLRKTILGRLAQTPRKELFIYVHGYDNSFQDAATDLQTSGVSGPVNFIVLQITTTPFSSSLSVQGRMRLSREPAS